MKIIFSTKYVKELLKISIYGTNTLQVLEQIDSKVQIWGLKFSLTQFILLVPFYTP